MAAQGDEVISAANLAAALGADAAGGIGGDPICVDNLAAVLAKAVPFDILYYGEPMARVPLTHNASNYDYIGFMCDTAQLGHGTGGGVQRVSGTVMPSSIATSGGGPIWMTFFPNPDFPDDNARVSVAFAKESSGDFLAAASSYQGYRFICVFGITYS